MTRGPRNRHRPSDELIRRRLVERRSDYDRRQADTGWLERLMSRKPATGGQASRNRLTLFGRLRRRPVTAYLLATIGSVALVAALIPTLRDAGPTARDDVAARTAQTAQDAQVTAERAAGVETATGRALLAETGGRLRPAIAAMPETLAQKPAMSEAAVQAALNLRLPPDADQIIAANENPDYLSTTGSVSRIIGDAESIAPPVPGAIDLGAVAPLSPIVPQVPTADTPPTANSAPVTADGRQIDAPASAAPQAGAIETAAVEPAPPVPDARVNASVNMRTKPENNATILSVLKKGTSVTVIECKSWCEIMVDGRTGFVFRDFVDRRG